MEHCALDGFYSPAQRSRFWDAVNKRRSVRSYRNGPDVAQLSALNFAAVRLCLPGVRIEMGEMDPELLFRHLPIVGGISGTDRFAAIIADESVPRAALHAGISGEAFILEATSLGLGTCWVASFRRKELMLPLKEQEKALAITPIGISNEVNAGRKRKKLTEICVGDPAAWPLWAYHAAECVRQAPSAVNMQPWKLSYAGHTLMLLKGGMSASPLDMGIALLHMSLGLGETPHQIHWGEGKEIASLITEDEA
ncbi:MAG: nitroreductase family protein [Clostridia bacterium]|nr:nitroreductase family protein [Clostridia bacterium]